MKVCLVRPPLLVVKASLATSSTVPPIALAYLQTVLKADGHSVDVIDAFGHGPGAQAPYLEDRAVVYGLTAEQIVDRIDPATQVIGVTCMFSNEWPYYAHTLKTIKNAFPDATLVVGGEHVTAIPQFVLDQTNGAVDYCVLGEGEQTIVALLRAIEDGSDIDKIAGLAYYDNDNQLINTGNRPRIRAIDEIPWPDWTSIPLDFYLNNKISMEESGKRTMPMLASRGCPYQCTFCSNPNMYGINWFARDPADVVAEIKHRIAQFNINHVEFYDLTSIVKKDWILAFAKMLVEDNVNITWAMPSGTRSEALDAEVLTALKASGVHYMHYAPESGSPTMLKRIKKKVKPKRILSSMRAAVKAGIGIRANIIVGLPGETKKEAWETTVFIAKMAVVGVNDVAAFPFVPYPGSELFEQLREQKILNMDDAEFVDFMVQNTYNNVVDAKSYNDHFTSQSIGRRVLLNMLMFYVIQFTVRPWRFVQAAYYIATRNPHRQFERMALTLLRRVVGHNFSELKTT